MFNLITQNILKYLKFLNYSQLNVQAKTNMAVKPKTEHTERFS